MSARARPRAFSSARSRMVLTGSSRARSMKAQVLTTGPSAAWARGTISWPAAASMPSISSESTWFFGQPRVVKWTFMGSPHDPIRPPTASNRRRARGTLREGLERPARLGRVLEVPRLEGGLELAARLGHLPLLGIDHPEVIAELGDARRGLRGGGEQSFRARQIALQIEDPAERIRHDRAQRRQAVCHPGQPGGPVTACG